MRILDVRTTRTEPEVLRTDRWARSGWLITLTDDAGHTAQGEASPLDGFSPDSSADVTSALAHIQATVGGWGPFDSLEAVESHLDAHPSWPASVRCAVEQALLGLLASRAGRSLCSLLGTGGRAAVASHRLVADVGAASRAVASGVLTLKIKVSAIADLALVADIRGAVGPDVELRVDANRAWTVSEARQALSRLRTLDVEFVEEPLQDPTPADLAALRVDTEVAIAADESCRSIEELRGLIEARSVDAVVLKPMFIGGLRRTVAMARVATAAGVDVVITHVLEGPVGRAGALAVARACPRGSLRTCGLALPTPTPPAVPCPIASSALARPSHPALIADDSSVLTWSELADRAARTAAWLHARGVRPGHVVSLSGVTGPELVSRLLGVAWLGAVAAPLPPEDQPLARDVVRPDFELGGEPLGALPQPLAERDWPLDEPRLLLTTSGTTGRPRPVTLTTSQVLFSAFGSAARLGHDPADTWLCCLPLHHVGGLGVLLRAALLGITVRLHDHFDASRVAAVLDGGGATLVSLVPTMLRRVLDARHDEPFPSSLRVILLGGGPASPDLLARCRALDAPVATTWGMTETASQIATREVGELSSTAGVGAPHPFARVHADPDGALIVTGPVTATGTLRTHDRGHVDEQGRVHVAGRADDAILSGGEVLDPREIEAALLGHAGVAEVLVVAVPDQRWGQRPAALLVAAEPSREHPDRRALRDWLGERIARYKAPDRVLWVERLPRTSLGKPSAALALELLVADEPEARQRAQELLGDGPLPEALEVHDDVRELHDGPQVIVSSSADVVLERDGGPAHALDIAEHTQRVAHAHRPLEVGLDVHERHAPAALVEDAGQRVIGGGQHLLEGGVGVLEGPPEEGDAGPIDLEETNGEVVLETSARPRALRRLRHGYDSRWRTR